MTSSNQVGNHPTQRTSGTGPPGLSIVQSHPGSDPDPDPDPDRAQGETSADGPAHKPAPSSVLPQMLFADSPEDTQIVALNDSAAVFAALADGIRGTAVGWSSTAVLRLESGLMDRYGSLLGGERAVKQLIVLACRSDAA